MPRTRREPGDARCGQEWPQHFGTGPGGGLRSGVPGSLSLLAVFLGLEGFFLGG